MQEINEVGNKYGKLLVVQKSTKTGNYGVYWQCKCDCGNTVDMLGVSLRNGKSVACGCNKGLWTGPQRTLTNRVLKSHFTSYKNSKSAKRLGFELDINKFESICRL